MNQEQQIKMLIVKGLIYRSELAEDAQKLRDLRDGRGSILGKVFNFISTKSDSKIFLLLTPVLKLIAEKADIPRHLSKVSITLGIGVLINLIARRSKIKMQHVETTIEK